MTRCTCSMRIKSFSTKQAPRRGIGKRINDTAKVQEMASFTEYVEYLQNRRRLLLTNFLAGMMRGMGFAVGFSILGAVVVVIAQKLALANLPGIGDFFAEVVRMVQMKLY